MTEERLEEIERHQTRYDGGGFPRISQDVADLIDEVRRLRAALAIIAGIPDEDGYTYGSTLHDVGNIRYYALGVLSGRSATPVGAAVLAGER